MNQCITLHVTFLIQTVVLFKTISIFASEELKSYDWTEVHTPDHYGRASGKDCQNSSQEELQYTAQRARSATEQVFDQLIHKKTGGLSSFISEVPCEFYVAKISGEPVALFVLSNRMVSINEDMYPSLEIDFIAVREDWRNKGIARQYHADV